MFDEKEQVGKKMLYEAVSLGIWGTEEFAGVLYKKTLEELQNNQEWYADKTKKVEVEIINGQHTDIKHKQKDRVMMEDRYLLYVKVIQCKDLIIQLSSSRHLAWVIRRLRSVAPL